MFQVALRLVTDMVNVAKLSRSSPLLGDAHVITGIADGSGVVCPHCGLLVQREKALRIVCPSCFGTFAMPHSSEWTMLVVPFLAIQYFSLFVL
jgi:hypothetical protein